MIFVLQASQELNSLRQTFAEDVADKQKKMDRLVKELHNMRAVTGISMVDKDKYEMEIKRLRCGQFVCLPYDSLVLGLLVEFVKSYRSWRRKCWTITNS